MSPTWQEVEDWLYSLDENATIGDAMASARNRRNNERPAREGERGADIMKCRSCGEDFDMTSLQQVFLHEHNGAAVPVPDVRGGKVPTFAQVCDVCRTELVREDSKALGICMSCRPAKVTVRPA